MGKCYSDTVEQALRYIYYDLRAQKGAEGLAMLEQAGNIREDKEELIRYRKTFFGKWVRR